MHIISTEYEHKSIVKCLEQQQLEEKVQLTLLKPNHLGVIDARSVLQAIKRDTLLISIMAINNEVGASNI